MGDERKWRKGKGHEESKKAKKPKGTLGFLKHGQFVQYQCDAMPSMPPIVEPTLIQVGYGQPGGPRSIRPLPQPLPLRQHCLPARAASPEPGPTGCNFHFSSALLEFYDNCNRFHVPWTSLDTIRGQFNSILFEGKYDDHTLHIFPLRDFLVPSFNRTADDI